MGNLIAQVSATAFGVAISPVPVVAVLIILLTKRARLSSFVFAVSWVGGLVLAITVGILFANKVHKPAFKMDLPIEYAVTALLGIGLVVWAILARRGRLRTEQPDPPQWVAAVDNLSPMGGALVAFSNAVTSPKNLALALAAGVSIRAATRVAQEQIVAGGVFVLIACTTVVIPVLVYFIAGKRATPILERWKLNITSRAALGMEILLFILGIGLAAKGVFNLFS